MNAKEKAEQSAAESRVESASLLDAAIVATKRTEPDQVKDLLRSLVEETMKGVVTWDKNVVKSINRGIAAIDEAISKQLAAIMHHEDFQKLEGSWRGLQYLVKNTETSTQLKLHVLNCSKRELFKDLDKAVEFDQSEIFKKVYGEFDVPGGVPYGALIGDYEFENSPDDISLLRKMSQVSAAGFCPFLSSASPGMLNMDKWTELSGPRDLAKIHDTSQFIQWRSFRESEDSRFVVLTMPRVLARLPYGSGTSPIDEFAFEEVDLNAQKKSKSVGHQQYCWTNAAYALGTRLTDAFAQTGFCVAIRGAEGGGKVEELPSHVFETDDGDWDQKCPTEIAIGDRREHELSKLGFLPICHYKNTDYAVFFGAQTTQQPKKYDRPEATENAAISARLPYLMATGRFAHFLKRIARDKIGSFQERQDMEDWMDRWIKNYVCVDPKPSPEVKARLPLADARVEVKEIPGQPGAYDAVVWMRPWLQLEELNASLRTVARVPRSKS